MSQSKKSKKPNAKSEPEIEVEKSYEEILDEPPDEAEIEARRADLKWTAEEGAFLHRAGKRGKAILSVALNTALAASCFGHYLHEFNLLKKQKKLFNENTFGIDLYTLLNCSQKERLTWVWNNRITDEPIMLLRDLINDKDEVTLQDLKNRLTVLRLSCAKVC